MSADSRTTCQKVCEVCGKVFEVERKQGFVSQKYCSPECAREHRNRKQREDHWAHREEDNEKAREYYKEHREEERAYQKNYYEEHREEIREIGRKYRERHREEFNEYQRRYYWEHREKIRESQRIWTGRSEEKKEERRMAGIKRVFEAYIKKLEEEEESIKAGRFLPEEQGSTDEEVI